MSVLTTESAPARSPAPAPQPAWLPAGVVLLIAALVLGLGAVSIGQEKNRYRERATAATENFARLLDQHLTDTFGRTDAILQSTTWFLRSTAAGATPRPDVIQAYMARAQALQPGLASIRILDRDGLVRHSSDTHVPDEQPVSLADRDYFQKARANPASGLIVSGPFLGRVTGRWVVVLARPLVDDTGAFAGVAIANLATDYFEKTLSQVSLGRHGAATIRTTDLALVHRVPAVKGKIGTREVSAELRAVIEASPQGGTFIAATAIDGIERTNAYRRLKDYPFYVLVGIATQDYLGGWAQNVTLVSTLSVLVVIAVALSAFLVNRAQRRLESDIAERVRIARELELAIEERGRLNLELAETARRAQAADRAKGVFLANMSHEIRTPLNGLIGMAHLVRRGGLTPEQAARMGKLEASAGHLLQVINAILDLSKIDAGKMALEERPLRVEALVADVLSLLEPRAEAQGLGLSSELGPMPPNLVGDPTRLQQALLNYGNNALKFTSAGQVSVRARVLEEDESGALLRFEVEDTGIGIDRATLDRLFTSFEQADASTTRKYGGTGLGLAITRRLAMLMGGDAGAESRPGQGSTFWFTARLRKAAQAPADPPVAREPALGPMEQLRSRHAGARVLVVEDNEINRLVAASLLEEAGLAPETACDGREALARLAAGDYRLVLMDMQMPVMDGLAATRAIRAAHPARRVPVIAMTANAFAEDRERCREAGMDDFIAKPVEPERLYETLLAWLDREPPAA